MQYKKCGASGLPLPRMTFGMWNGFSPKDDQENAKRLILKAIDMGITHIDGGYANGFIGEMLKNELKGKRDQIIFSSKVGFGPPPFANTTCRKAVFGRLDMALREYGVDYIDIFYLHRYDEETPLEESVTALADAVKSGKALYAGISNFPPDMARAAADIMKRQGVPLTIHQLKYSILTRSRFDADTRRVVEDCGMGVMAFSPVEQGILSDKYLNGVPEGSRASKGHSSFKMERLTEERIEAVRKLNALAQERGQKLAEMAINWVLANPAVTSALIGASSAEQLESNIKALESMRDFTSEELELIDSISEPVWLPEGYAAPSK